MTLRQQSAKWGASHALVSFLDDKEQPTCIIPTKRIKDCSTMREGAECQVLWSDGKTYCAKVLALGSLSTMVTAQCDKEKADTGIQESIEDTTPTIVGEDEATSKQTKASRKRTAKPAETPQKKKPRKAAQDFIMEVHCPPRVSTPPPTSDCQIEEDEVPSRSSTPLLPLSPQRLPLSLTPPLFSPSSTCGQEGEEVEVPTFSPPPSPPPRFITCDRGGGKATTPPHTLFQKELKETRELCQGLLNRQAAFEAFVRENLVGIAATVNELLILSPISPNIPSGKYSYEQSASVLLDSSTPCRTPFQPLTTNEQTSSSLQTNDKSLPPTPEINFVLTAGLKAKSCSRENFAAHMVRELFTEAERVCSNVSGARGKQKLDGDVMEDIKEETFKAFPLTAAENPSSSWKRCIKAIDAASRSLKHGKEN